MVQILTARQLSLEELQAAFGLQQNLESNFFTEWQNPSFKLSSAEKQSLERVKTNYLNLTQFHPLSEEMVKMVILSPLLDLAGFYQSPFKIKTEPPVEITVEEKDIIIKGNIDVLVIQKQFWVLVIESKNSLLDVMAGLPQALVYMLGTPTPEVPTYGLLVNGREFVFIKLVQKPLCEYSRSYALSIERDNDLEEILKTLKTISQLIL